MRRKQKFNLIKFLKPNKQKIILLIILWIGIFLINQIAGRISLLVLYRQPFLSQILTECIQEGKVMKCLEEKIKSVTIPGELLSSFLLASLLGFVIKLIGLWVVVCIFVYSIENNKFK